MTVTVRVGSDLGRGLMVTARVRVMVRVTVNARVRVKVWDMSQPRIVALRYASPLSHAPVVRGLCSIRQPLTVAQGTI